MVEESGVSETTHSDSNGQYPADFPHDLRKICEIVGDGNWSLDPMDLAIYSRDLAPIPDELLHSYGALPPQLVVRPRSTEQVSSIMAWASEREIPITPRGGGSFAMGGTIPIEGGVVLDLCSLNAVLEVNEADQYVRVQCGVVWRRLIEALAQKNLTMLANPSSGVSATVGGYIGTGGGAGIGVPRWGVLGNSVLSLKVVLPSGKIIETNPWTSWQFIGAEGTLGIVVEAVIRVAPLREQRYYMFGFADLNEGCKALQALAHLKPYYFHFFDRGGIKLLIDSGAHLEEAALTVVVGFHESPARQALVARELDTICAGARRYDQDVARHEWDDRYNVEVSFKRLGPTIMVQEIRLPIQNVGAVLAELATALASYNWGVQCLSSDHSSVCLLINALTDERNAAQFYKAMSLAGVIPRIGYRNHGTVYGLGLHNTAHLKRIHRRSAWEAMQRMKAKLDPENILNPSKTVQVRVPGPLVGMSMVMMGQAPGMMALGLKVAKQMPTDLIRSGLKMVGGDLR